MVHRYKRLKASGTDGREGVDDVGKGYRNGGTAQCFVALTMETTMMMTIMATATPIMRRICGGLVNGRNRVGQKAAPSCLSTFGKENDSVNQKRFEGDDALKSLPHVL